MYKYLDGSLRIYAFVFMPNHFHILLKSYKRSVLEKKYKIYDEKLISQKLSKQLSNLFNSYAQYFNKRHERMGSLFMRPFKRKEILDEDQLRKIIHYIHNNPVKHGFVKSII
jgi:REP element-mobilizing transposase RayT